MIGTTDIHAADPDEIPVTQEEVDQMLDDGERLVPGFRQARALRVWAGARPLFQDARAGEVTDTRDVSRTHAVVDHAGARRREGAADDVRRQAHDAAADGAGPGRRDVRAARRRSGHAGPRRSSRPATRTASTTDIGSRLRRRERTLADEQLICECELIGRRQLEEELVRRGTTNLDDIRRALRLGMGPCQGGFCIYRATGIMHEVEHLDGEQAAASLLSFLQERWKGVWPILYGDQLRQARLDDWIFQGLLDVEHLPDGEVSDESSRRARGRHRAGRPDRRGPAGASRGARVRVLAKGIGATHLGGGTIDVLGYAPERVDRPGEALPAFAAAHPGHPYARVGVERHHGRARLVQGRGRRQLARALRLHRVARREPPAADGDRRAAAFGAGAG